MSAQGPRIAAVALSHSPQMAQDTNHVQGRRFRDGFAQVAKAVGRQDDYRFFLKRSQAYKNLFNKERGFMQARNADGRMKVTISRQTATE